MYRTLHPKSGDYTFFTGAHGSFSWVGNILGYKTHLNKFKKLKIISIFSDCSSIKLEISYKKILELTQIYED